MNRRRKRRTSLVPLICMIAVLVAIVSLRIAAHNEEPEAPEQMTGKLEIHALSDDDAPGELLIQEPRQISEPPEYTSADYLYAMTTDRAVYIQDEYMPARVARYIDIEMSSHELWEFAAIVQLEAGNQSADGQQAVAEVILNRVIHPGFPDTVHGVIHDDGGIGVVQFTTVANIDAAEPTQAQYDAIFAALYGDTILPDNVVFFSRSGENDRVWGKIGDHVFCYEYDWWK